MKNALDTLSHDEQKLAAIDMQYTVERWFRMYGYGETLQLVSVAIYAVDQKLREDQVVEDE